MLKNDTKHEYPPAKSRRISTLCVLLNFALHGAGDDNLRGAGCSGPCAVYVLRILRGGNGDLPRERCEHAGRFAIRVLRTCCPSGAVKRDRNVFEDRVKRIGQHDALGFGSFGVARVFDDERIRNLPVPRDDRRTQRFADGEHRAIIRGDSFRRADFQIAVRDICGIRDAAVRAERCIRCDLCLVNEHDAAVCGDIRDRNDERRLRRCGGRGLQDAVYIIPNRIRHIRERIDGPAIKFIRAEVIGDREICHRLRTAVYDRNDIRNLIVCGVIFHHGGFGNGQGLQKLARDGVGIRCASVIRKRREICKRCHKTPPCFRGLSPCTSYAEGGLNDTFERVAFCILHVYFKKDLPF